MLLLLNQFGAIQIVGGKERIFIKLISIHNVSYLTIIFRINNLF